MDQMLFIPSMYLILLLRLLFTHLVWHFLKEKSVISGPINIGLVPFLRYACCFQFHSACIIFWFFQNVDLPLKLLPAQG